MMKMGYIKSFLIFILLTISCSLSSQIFNVKIAPQQNEKWWGASTALGAQMPFDTNTKWIDIAINNMNNQTSPLLLSSTGRYIWSNKPFRFQVKDDTLIINSDYEQVGVIQAGKNLRDAYLVASQTHFPPSEQIPPQLFFSLPQYNTWIELMYNQNQTDISNYAKDISKHNFSPGIFMIDDNWQKYYGNFDFKAEKFPSPKAMTDSLHHAGFKVMLWVCPYVSPDSPEFRMLSQKGYLLKAKKTQQPALIHWWNGFSACYDLTNPKAVEYLIGELKDCQKKYGIDGFKFDGADVAYMQEGAYNFYDQNALITDYTQKWAELGLHFPYNEYRATWKMGGQHLVQRLGDKNYSWDAVSTLIPEIIAAGLLGYFYTCPDMIGGGQFSAFLNIRSDKFDQELVVRSAQIHALMPMMQFSVAPWRILDKEHLDACQKAIELHQNKSDYIIQCAIHSSKTGEPIIRSLEYMFPHNGYKMIKDQFMLGDKLLVAPVVTPNNKRTVILPKGKWKDDLGKIFKGPKQIEIVVPIDRLPYYERLSPL